MFKKYNLTSLFCFFSIGLGIQLFGQTLDLEFDHYTANEGLSNGFILSMTQDSKGFMWFGTYNGLNRFDGLSFKVYQFDTKDTNSITGNVINVLIEDSANNLWALTNHNLCCYNRNLDNFSRKIFKVNNTLFNYEYITGGMIDSHGNMWVGTTHGIFRFKIYNNPNIYNHVINADRYVLYEPDMKDVNKTTVYSFIEDKKGIIWACSYSNNLFSFDERQKNFVSYPIQHPGKLHFTGEQKSMIQDRDGDFNITINNNGLLVWYRNEGKFVLYKKNGTDNAPNDNILFGLFENTDGSIWMGGRTNGGINIFNKKTGKFKYCYHDKTNSYSLNTNKIQAIYQDRIGNLWIGGIIGLNKYSPGQQKFKRYFCNNKTDGLSNNTVLCFAESKNGKIWVGTDGGGLNLLDRNTGKFIQYLHDPFNSNSLSNNAIVSLIEDHDGILYAGTFTGGLDQKIENNFKAYIPDQSNPYSISTANIWFVFEDSRKNLWAASLDHGLDFFDKKNQRFYNYLSNTKDSTSLIANALFSMFEDSQHNLYITSGEGVSIIDLNKYDFSRLPVKIKFRNINHNPFNNNSLSSDGVYCVNEDNEKNIWFGMMSTGLDKYDPKTGRYKNYSINEGLPGKAINSILMDKQNNLWLGTDKGLAKFNPKNNEIRVFDRLDGLQNTNFHGWALKAKDGEMFFGGPEGFNSFYPDKIKYNTNKPKVIIIGLKIFNRPIKISEKINNRIILTKDISETKSLIISYKENYFAFDFIALDYVVPIKNQYKYKLEGFDKEWIKCGTKREASYTNLDPGRYIFKVTACNNDGVWNDNYTSIILNIEPPFWATTWFRLFVIALFLALLLSFYYFRLFSIRRKNYMLEHLVEERTQQINEKNLVLSDQAVALSETNTLMEERQQQIEEQSEELKVQRDQLSLINATKDKLFTILAHDLRNPFHVISGFTELLINDLKELTENKILKYLGLIYTSSVRGNDLLENLLQWSRTQTGKINFEPKELNLSSIAEEVKSFMEGIAQKKNIVITQLIDPKIVVYADENMLKTIFRNLISNAIKFTSAKGTITLSANLTTDNDLIEIAVSDNGVGIPENTIQNLFRVDSAISTKGTDQEPGTGLGLIICKEFVEIHNGKIRVQSKVNSGTTFYFTLSNKYL